MPRKNKNTRKIRHTRKLNLNSKPKKRYRAVLVPKHKIKDNISPGWLVAAAEWRKE